MYQGILDDVGSILSTFGISGDSAAAVAQAYASPTIANINAVQAAFTAEGNTAPPELLNALWGRYYDSIKQNPLASAGQLTSLLSSPIVWAIGAGLLFLAFKKKG
jgi:hypothetical protein